MAKRIEGPYDFSEHGFATFADGATWECTQGEDFPADMDPQLYRRRARSFAKREGLMIEDKIYPATAKAKPKVALRFTPKVRTIGRTA